jgi:double zinc ribbon protein
MTLRDKRSIKSEILVIPGWAYVVAMIVFLLVPICFYMLSGVWAPNSGVALPFKILLTVFPGTILAFLALMVGYVNNDAGQRGMSRTLWTLLVIFIPNAVGFILYFFLRNPLQTKCPTCGMVVDQRVNFCPSCRYSFHQTCPKCGSAVRPGDTFCANCGDTIPQP